MKNRIRKLIPKRDGLDETALNATAMLADNNLEDAMPNWRLAMAIETRIRRHLIEERKKEKAGKRKKTAKH